MKRMIELVKQHWVWIVLILMVIGLALVSYFRSQYKEQTPTNQPRSAQTSDKEKEGKTETANEKAYRKAKLALEHPYSAVSDEVKQSVTPDIVSALDFITSHANLDDMTPPLDNHLYISEAKVSGLPSMPTTITFNLPSWKCLKVIVMTWYRYC